METTSTIQAAVLGGGCFWCTEAAFREIEGVIGVVSGYSAGHRPNPTYDRVVTGLTGHAQVVEITFDTKIINYSDILDIFWAIHNPTTLNKQGYDIGTDYRSIILYKNEEQKKIAEDSISAISKLWPDPIVTELLPLDIFYPAEDYHQQYFAKNPTQGYCVAVINPKLITLREKFRSRLRKS